MAFEASHKVQESVQTRLADVGSAALSPLAMARVLLTTQAPERDREVEELRRRLAELENRLPKQRRTRRKTDA